MSTTARLADRLAAARQRSFVGRTAELALFREALLAPELPFALLAVYGPEGIGKTTLLRELARLCDECGVPSVRLDSRTIDATPESFIAALAAALDLPVGASPLEALAARTPRQVLLLDTYEALAPLDVWLRDVFFPQMPEGTLIVLASNAPLAPEWRADPGWQPLLRALPLRNLSPAESATYLTARGVPASEHHDVLAFTHGHPLALSLVADLFGQRPEARFTPEDAPDVIKVLLERFVQQVPGPAHRAALEACALLRLTTESLLAEMLQVPDAHELFSWLRGLSLTEAGREGLFPHSLVREALAADLRWRNPDWYAELHRRARDAYAARLRATRDHAEQQRILLDYVYLHRENPLLKPYRVALASTPGDGAYVADRLRDGDAPALVAMVARHEGLESARLAELWIAAQPGGVTVIRDAAQRPAGFVAAVALEEASADQIEADPATRAAWVHARAQVRLRDGERAVYMRFWMAADTYQELSHVQVLIGVQVIRGYLTTPGLVSTYFPCASPEFWGPLLLYSDLRPVPEASFEVGGRTYTVFGHDWRATPPMAWLELLAGRETTRSASLEPPAPAAANDAASAALNRDEFVAAIRAALHDYTRADKLRASPLLRARLVTGKVGVHARVEERTAALRELLKTTAETLQASPKDARLYRVLYHTCLQPAPTQERAAELLDLPFSTYRRYLKTATERVAGELWRRELEG